MTTQYFVHKTPETTADRLYSRIIEKKNSCRYTTAKNVPIISYEKKL
jgi:hypothetical protein